MLRVMKKPLNTKKTITACGPNPARKYIILSMIVISLTSALGTNIKNLLCPHATKKAEIALKKSKEAKLLLLLIQ